MANSTNSTATVTFRDGRLQRLRKPKGTEAIDGTAVTSGSTTVSAVYETHRYAQARVSVFVPAAGTDTDSTFTLQALTGPTTAPTETVLTSTGAASISFNGAHNAVYTYPGLNRHFRLSLAAASTGANPAVSTAVYFDVEFV